jgi:hypothetical protein
VLKPLHYEAKKLQAVKDHGENIVLIFSQDVKEQNILKILNGGPEGT